MVDLAVVADEGFEFAAEFVALDPVDHVAAKRGAGSDGAVRVDEIDVVAKVLEDFDEIAVGGAAPVCLDLVGEGLAVGWRSSELNLHSQQNPAQARRI